METYIRNKAVENYAKELEESFDDDCEAHSILLDSTHMTNVYGRTYAMDPKQFQFHAGDIKLIKSLVEYVKIEVDEKGANKGLHKFQGKRKKSTRSFGFNRMSKENLATNIQLKDQVGHDTAETNPRHATLKTELFQKTMACLKSYGVDEPVAASFDDKMIEVHFEKNRIYGSINCVICNDKNAELQKAKRVYYHESSKSSYWVMANFSKHLETTHHLSSTKKHLSNKAKRKNSVHAEQNANVLKPKNGFPGAKNVIDNEANSVAELMVKPVIKKTEEVFDEHEDDEPDYEIVSVYMEPKVNVETDSLYKQMSQQMTKMVEAVLINCDVQDTLKFELEGQERSVTVAQIDGNGDCLYAAICHQLFHSQIGSESHIEQTANLRKSVVDYILKPENYPSFEFILQDRVYEMKKCGTIENITNECKIYARLVLSRSGQWAGNETIKAVGEMYKTNIVIFKEDRLCYIANTSTEVYDRTIAIAYRKAPVLGVDNDEDLYNHYDSISDIDTQLLYEVVNSITK